MASPDEEPEPQLKYELLGGDVQSILSKEKVSCMTVSEKILAIGTEQGRIHVLDYSGNQVRLLNLHKSRVNDLSFDKEGEHLASASNDCSVVVSNLYTDQVTRQGFHAPIKVVALDPRPPASTRKSWRDLVTGTAAGEVTLHTQGWLARSDTLLSSAAARDVAGGGVLALKWAGTLVAWAYDSCVMLYDTTAQQLLRTLRRHELPSASASSSRNPKPAAKQQQQQTSAETATAAAAAGTARTAMAPAQAPAAATDGGSIGSLRRCSVLFAPDSHLYVAWSDTLLVARIWSYENNVGSLSPQVELVARMKLGEAVLGVSPYGDSDLAVLVYPNGSPTSASTKFSQQQQDQQHRQPDQQQWVIPKVVAEDSASSAAGGSSPARPPSAAAAAPDQATDGRATAADDGGPSLSPSSLSSAAGGPPAEGAATADGAGGSAGGRNASGCGAGAATQLCPSPTLEPPPDPLAPGRTPQLVILGRSDHREWARDAVPLPGAERCGPADYLSLMPSLPHHLHVAASTAAAAAPVRLNTTDRLSTTGSTAPAAASAGTTYSSRAASSAAAVVDSSGFGGGGSVSEGASTLKASLEAPCSSGGGGGQAAAAAVPTDSVGVSEDGAALEAAAVTSCRIGADATTATSGAGPSPAASPAAAAPRRRLVPVWVDGQELIFFIAAPMAVAFARSRDAADRVGWLLVRRRWEEALSAVEEAPQGLLPPGTYDRVVDGYIEELLTRQSYDTAVELSERLLKDDPKRWERWAYLFAQARQLPKLVSRLPTQQPRLRSQVYDMALQSLLPNPADHPTLVALARRWPLGCYSLAVLADAVAARLRRMQLQLQVPPPHQHHHPPAPAGAALTGATAGAGGDGMASEQQAAAAAAMGPLWQLLAWLYEQQGRPDLALSIHLRLRSPAVFGFVAQHGLQANLLGRAPDLFDVDERAALALLVSAVDTLPPSNVVPSLQEAQRAAGSPAASEQWRRRLFAYLQAMFAADSSVGSDYHDLQVSLTAEYQPAKLMDLLVSSQYYSLEAALAICEARGLVSEQVFILGRMGNSDQALRLIIDQLGDIPRAIDFVVGQRDEELWGRLIDWALGSSETTGSLLDCIGGHVDPILLVRRIPRGMRVERLRDRLRAIIADYRTQTSLREGCNAILRSDCRHLLAKLYDGTRRALPYAYVLRPDAGGEGGGQWYRCDVVHGGRLQPVSSSEVPEEALPALSGPGRGGGSASTPSPPAATAAAAAGRSRSSTANLLSSSVTTTPLPGQAGGGGGGGLTRTHGSSAPALNRAYGGGGRAFASVVAMEGLPWWAHSGGLEAVAAAAATAATAGGRGGSLAPTCGSDSGAEPLWVGFSLSAGRAHRLGLVEDVSGTAAGGFGGRRAAPPGRSGSGAGAAAVASGGGGGGGWPAAAGMAGPSSVSGSGSSGAPLGSLWRHVAAV